MLGRQSSYDADGATPLHPHLNLNHFKVKWGTFGNRGGESGRTWGNSGSGISPLAHRSVHQMATLP